MCLRYCGGIIIINCCGTFVFVRWCDKSTDVQLRIFILMAHRTNKLVGDSATFSYDERKSGTCEINTSTWITGNLFCCIYFIMSEARKYSGKSGCRESTQLCVERERFKIIWKLSLCSISAFLAHKPYSWFYIFFKNIVDGLFKFPSF